MLWLGLAGRNSGTRPSRLVGIADPVVALDFDLACTDRLLGFDNERRQEDFKALAAMLGVEKGAF